MLTVVVGCSPAAAFLSWRLDASQSYSVSIAWKEFANNANSADPDSLGMYSSPVKRTFSIKSAKFGGPSASLFTPEGIHDPTRLDLVNPLTPYDFILFSPASLKNLASFHRIVSSNLVLPNHTIILVESSGYVGLHQMIASRFPNNPVCAIATEAQVRMVPPPDQGYAFNGQDPLLLLLHSGDVTGTVISPPGNKFSEPTYMRRLKSLSLALQTAGVDAAVSSTYEHFQWHQMIPLVAFQPLSVILEASTPQALVNNVLSKPLFSGIISELMTLARKQSDCKFPSDYLATTISKFLDSYSNTSNATRNATFTTSSSPQSSSSSSSSLTYSTANPAYIDSPLLFYNYFHSLPVYPDLLLLQPILLADDHGIKTPYLESAFAFLSQLVFYNTSNNSIFLTRIHDKKKQPQPDAQYLSTTEGLEDRMKSLDLREKSQEDRERQLELKQQKLDQWNASLQKQAQQLQQQQAQQQQQPPMPPQHLQNGPSYAQRNVYTPSYANSNNNGYGPGYMKQRPMSVAPSLTPTMTQMQPPVENPDLIDMMAMTTRKNRRSVGGRGMRNSASSQSLASIHGPGSRAASMSQFANPALSRGGRVSVNEAMIAEVTGMDGLGTLTSNRYGNVDSATLAQSRTNSLTADSFSMRNGGGGYAQSISSPALFRDHFSPHMNDSSGGAYPLPRQGSVGGFENGYSVNGGYTRPNGPMQRHSVSGPAPQRRNSQYANGGGYLQAVKQQQSQYQQYQQQQQPSQSVRPPLPVPPQQDELANGGDVYDKTGATYADDPLSTNPYIASKDGGVYSNGGGYADGSADAYGRAP